MLLLLSLLDCSTHQLVRVLTYMATSIQSIRYSWLATCSKRKHGREGRGGVEDNFGRSRSRPASQLASQRRILSLLLSLVSAKDQICPPVSYSGSRRSIVVLHVYVRASVMQYIHSSSQRWQIRPSEERTNARAEQLLALTTLYNVEPACLAGIHRFIRHIDLRERERDTGGRIK